MTQKLTEAEWEVVDGLVRCAQPELPPVDPDFLLKVGANDLTLLAKAIRQFRPAPKEPEKPFEKTCQNCGGCPPKGSVFCSEWYTCACPKDVADRLQFWTPQ